MCKELSLNRNEIEESLKKALYNNIMATYLLLARHGGNYNNYNNRVLTSEVLFIIFKN
jgi:hypothetical protein